MKLSDFDFYLPPELIAQKPLQERSFSRLLCMDKKERTIKHIDFRSFPSLLSSSDLLVFNDTRVIPARIFAYKETGGKVEILIERILNDEIFLAHVKASKKIKIGTLLLIDGEKCSFSVESRDGDLFILQLKSDLALSDVLEKFGHIPLPPYIERSDEALDRERYQTVFAKNKGAVAAPTAGLHFDEFILNSIKERGIDIAFITLHVGAGTFQPVRSQSILEHKMHKERFVITEDTVQKIAQAKARGGRVIAVGTTVVRSLESAALSGEVKPFCGETDIFIYPGFKFRCVDAILTNFHLPKSTLLMLIASFCDLDFVMRAYSEAIENRYRFFSYGDAMFIA